MTRLDEALAKRTSIEPGIFTGLAFAEYLALDAANFHGLKPFDRSPEHAREEILNPKLATPGMIVGSAFHTAILEPNEFTSRFVVHPEINGKRANKATIVGKAAWEEHDERERGKRETVTRAAYEGALRARDKVWEHPAVRELLGGAGSNEVSVVWKDEPTGELCKARPDRVTDFGGWTTIVDIKKTADAQAWRFEADAAKYRYHVQAAMYLYGLDAHDERDRRHIILAIEETRPFGIRLFEYDQEALDAGGVDFRAWLTGYTRARRENLWPGYPVEVRSIGIPKYLKR